jgi:uncharacterized protein YjbI with pentapeptide repeats
MEERIASESRDSSTSRQLTGLFFLRRSKLERVEILVQLGLSRYCSLLAEMSLTENNVRCVDRFLTNPHAVKFPQLQKTDLQGLNLDGVNWIRGNLTEANLTGCSLVSADLLFVNFTNANLTDANLTGTTLNETRWQDTIVSGCIFHDCRGLTFTQQSWLISRGAVFDLT